MLTSSDGLRQATYKTSLGTGLLLERDGLLAEHRLPFAGQRHAIAGAGARNRPQPASGINPRLLGLAASLEAYFRGETIDFSAEWSFLDLAGWTPFALDVARALCAVPYGEQATYAELAAAAGHPDAQRAVGSVMARNPFPVLLPCHRVVRSDGSLGGFSAGAGISLKRKLLQLEGSLSPRQSIE